MRRNEDSGGEAAREQANGRARDDILYIVIFEYIAHSNQHMHMNITTDICILNSCD